MQIHVTQQPCLFVLMEFFELANSIHCRFIQIGFRSKFVMIGHSLWLFSFDVKFLKPLNLDVLFRWVGGTRNVAWINHCCSCLGIACEWLIEFYCFFWQQYANWCLFTSTLKVKKHLYWIILYLIRWFSLHVSSWHFPIMVLQLCCEWQKSCSLNLKPNFLTFFVSNLFMILKDVFDRLTTSNDFDVV